MTVQNLATEPSAAKGMRADKYNSSSYVAGLLQSVTGHVPSISAPEFQAPGWESPMPGHFFKDEAIR